MTGAAGPSPRRPLSTAQQGVWMARRLHPDRVGFRLGELVRIDGPFDVRVFEAALSQALREADALRVRVEEDEDGIPWLCDDGVQEPELRTVDVTGEPDPDAVVRRHAEHGLSHEVDASAGRACTFTLFRTGPEQHVWFHGYDHVAIDGVGCSLFVARVAALYTASSGGAAATAPSFGSARHLDHEARRYQESDRCARDRAFWHDQLPDWPTPPRLSGDGGDGGDGRTRRRVAALHPPLATAVSATATALGVRPSRVLVAALGAFLARRCGVQRTVVSLPMAGRATVLERRTPALMANVLPLRLVVPDDVSVGELVLRVASSVDDVVEHQRYRGEWIYAELRRRRLAHPRLFGPLVNVMLFDREVWFGPCRAAVSNVSLRDVEDVALSVYGTADAPARRLDVEVDGARHGAAAHVGLVDDLVGFLSAFCSDPDSPVGFP